MSFVGFAESYTEVFKNTDGLPTELQQAITKQNGIKYYVANTHTYVSVTVFPEFYFRDAGKLKIPIPIVKALYLSAIVKFVYCYNNCLQLFRQFTL